MNIAEQFLTQYPVARGAHVIDLQNVEDLIWIHKSGPDSVQGLCVRPPWTKTLAFFSGRDGDWKKYRTEFVVFCQYGESADKNSAVLFVWEACLRRPQNSDLLIPVARVRQYLDPGFISRGETQIESWVSEELHLWGPEQQQVVIDGINFTLFVGLAFCHCRNCKIEKVLPSRQVQRRAARKGDPVFEHHRIVIEPMRQVLVKEGGLAQHGNLARAMHICRGHFAHYGEEFGTGKLFGKYEGQYWMPQHIRGKLEAGVITKDYKVSV